MDVEEAVRRLRANLIIIVGGIVLGLAVATAIHVGEGRVYRASARILFDVKQPRSASSSEINVDTARGIIASDTRVATALRAAGVPSSASRFARDNVRLRSVGASAVLELSVTYHSGATATKIANTLADELTKIRNDLSKGGYEELLGDLDRRLAAANAEVARRQGELQASAGQRGLSPVRENYQEAVRQRDDLEAERRRLTKDYAERPQAAVIEPAAKPRETEPSNLLADLVLGAVLGLALGIFLAGLRETIRPTIAGERSITRLLGAPSLGTLPKRPSAVDDAGLSPIASHVRLAAEAAGVRTVALSAAGNGAMDLDRFAHRLHAAIDVEENVLRLVSHDPHSSIQVLSADGAGLRTLGESPATVGLVLVSPTVLKRRHLDALGDLRSMSGWQLLGVITYRRRGHGGGRTHESDLAAEPAEDMGETAMAMAPAAAESSMEESGEGLAKTIVLDQAAASSESQSTAPASDGGPDPDGSREWAPSRWK